MKSPSLGFMKTYTDLKIEQPGLSRGLKIELKLQLTFEK